jgi:Protein of unknown function (DUF1549)/Protein of unknown function (DUF1553)
MAYRFAIFVVVSLIFPVLGDEPVHVTIDRLIADKAKGQAPSPPADDGEFLRRVHLDLAGSIPTAEQARAFFSDRTAGKRQKLIDALLSAPSYATRMADFFNVMLMERLGEQVEWANYLKLSFEQNKHWDAMARDLVRGDASDTKSTGATFFLAKRLENYGQNPVDYPALTRDIGRLFLGKNLQCAQCHDHIFIDDYKQKDFQGLFAFVQNSFLVDAKAGTIGEKPTTGKTAFMSVFKKQPRETGPAIPGGREFEPLIFKKGEEFAVPPDPKTKAPGKPKFSPLNILAEELPRKNNLDFARNGANRIWFMLMGRGIVHPLDLHHAGNPPSHPELLNVLADQFAAHDFDIKWLVREIALTNAYQRSSRLPDGVDKIGPETFLTAIEKRMSAEQLFAAVQQATGVKADAAARAKFMKAFTNAAREPEDDVNPSLKGALFLLNDPTILGWLQPQSGNLVDRLRTLADEKIAYELYLSVLTRVPAPEEREALGALLKKDAANRPATLGKATWALLSSTEFGVNH